MASTAATSSSQLSPRKTRTSLLRAGKDSLSVLDGTQRSSIVSHKEEDGRTAKTTRNLLATSRPTQSFKAPPKAQTSTTSRDSMFVGLTYPGGYHLPEMAVASGLKNQEAVKSAAIQLVNLSTPNDPRHPQYYDMTLTGHQRFPYQQTRSGAMNMNLSPYERQRRFWQMSGAGTLFLLMAVITRRPF